MEGKSKGTIERYSGAGRDGTTITTAERRVYQFSQFGLRYLRVDVQVFVYASDKQYKHPVSLNLYCINVNLITLSTVYSCIKIKKYEVHKCKLRVA